MIDLRTVCFDSSDEGLKILGAKQNKNNWKWYVRRSQRHLFTKWIDVAPTEYDDKVIVLDLHTNGFPLFNKSYTNLDAFANARMVSLNLVYADVRTFSVIERQDYIIKPDGFRITNSQYHGVTDEVAHSQGEDIHVVFDQLRVLLEKTTYIVSHNNEFDLSILNSELYRFGQHKIIELLESKVRLCSMNFGANVMQQNKYPSLYELVTFALHEPFPKKISYTTNVDCLLQCLQTFVNTKMLRID